MNSSENKGYWDWTWEPNTVPPETSTLSIAFSGWTNPAEALSQSKKLLNTLTGDKYICLGGGNSNGAFTREALNSITNAINNNEFSNYDGIAFDVEEGDSGLESDFAASFLAAKNKGFKVLVTVSHSAPYGISDAQQLMNSFFVNENIDILSPQLYTTGQEIANDYAISHNVTWAEYKKAKASIVPSIVQASFYESAQKYFLETGVILGGYIQWKQS